MKQILWHLTSGDTTNEEGSPGLASMVAIKGVREKVKKTRKEGESILGLILSPFDIRSSWDVF